MTRDKRLVGFAVSGSGALLGLAMDVVGQTVIKLVNCGPSKNVQGQAVNTFKDHYRCPVPPGSNRIKDRSAWGLRATS